MYYVKVDDTEDYRLLAVLPKAEIKHFVNRTVTIATIVFGSVLLILLFYSIFLSSDIQKGVIEKET